MSQRNPMNPRSQARQKHGDGIKGAARKSASSAKPARPAGGSVYVSTSKSKGSGGNKQDVKDKRELEKRRERAMGSMVYDMPEYKKWRRVWWVCLIVAIVAVVGSFGINWLDGNGYLTGMSADVKGPLATTLLVIGYGALILGLIVDFTKMRKLRKEQQAKAYNLSKSERRKLDAAIEQSERERAEQRAEKKAKGRRGKRAAQGAGSEGQAKE